MIALAVLASATTSIALQTSDWWNPVERLLDDVELDVSATPGLPTLAVTLQPTWANPTLDPRQSGLRPVYYLVPNLAVAREVEEWDDQFQIESGAEPKPGAHVVLITTSIDDLNRRTIPPDAIVIDLTHR
jgi:hypothetical protein